MTKYVGVTGQGVPLSPYITHGKQLAADLRRLARLADEIGDLSPVQVAATLDLAVLDALGNGGQRLAAIDGLSHTLAGTGCEQSFSDGVGGVVLRRTAPLPRLTGQVAVVVYGQVSPDVPAPDGSES